MSPGEAPGYALGSTGLSKIKDDELLDREGPPIAILSVSYQVCSSRLPELPGTTKEQPLHHSLYQGLRYIA